MYLENYEIKIKFDSLKSFTLFGLGFMTLFHMVVTGSYFLYGLVILILTGLSFLLYVREYGFLITKKVFGYLSWYGVFVLFIIFSSIYTVNDINPDYVLKRVLVIFLIALSVSALIEEESDFKKLSDGMIWAALLTFFVVLVNEGLSIGVGRIGSITTGSAVNFSGILLVSCILSSNRWIFEDSKWFYKIVSIISIFGIVLSGSRRALIITFLIIMLLYLFNKAINKTKKIIVVCMFISVFILGVIFIMNNEELYNVFGKRLVTMMDTLLNQQNEIVDGSMSERYEMIKYGYDLFLEKPVYGYGVHGFAYMFNAYYGELLYSHNGFIEILSCYGILGFILFYRYFFSMIIAFFRKKSIKTNTQIMLILYIFITLACEVVTISFIMPQVIVLLTAAYNLIRFKYDNI